MRSLALLLLSAMFAGAAAADSCGGAADDPMSWGNGFGVSQCKVKRERYHLHDYDGEGARNAAPGADDPMTWRGDQWRSDLFGGYRQNNDDRYDRRLRPAAASGRPVAAPVPPTAAAAPAVEAVKLRGPKLIHLGPAPNWKANTGVLRFDGHGCQGVLVLTWGTLGSKQRCYSSRSRIRSSSGEGY